MIKPALTGVGSSAVGISAQASAGAAKQDPQLIMPWMDSFQLLSLAATADLPLCSREVELELELSVLCA